MPYLKQSKNLLFGNGDLFLSSNGTVNLPSESAYKSAITNGTLANLAGGTGAVKGNVELIIDRKVVDFKVGIPQEVADQTVSEEHVTLKCSLAELTLADLQLQLGLPSSDYTTSTSGATLISNEADTVYPKVAVPFVYGPVLNTTTSPTSAAPVVRNASTTSTIYVEGTDYVVDYTNGLLIALATGALNVSGGTAITITYYYNAVSSEKLTIGGQNVMNSVALRFFHPYPDGRVLYVTIPKANPTGAITIPFDEVNYSLRTVEFTAIADFTQPQGQYLGTINRDTPTTAPVSSGPVIL